MLRREASKGTRGITKSIRLTEGEAAELAAYVKHAGGTEAALLKEAMLRGLRDIRFARANAAFVAGASSCEAAEIAGQPRAHFLEELADQGVPITLGAPISIRAQLDAWRAAEKAAEFEPAAT